MSDEVKYTGPTTLAKNTALVKAELGKKLDKTGGTLTGDLTISGAWLNVKSTDTGDGNISVDGSLVAGRGVSVLNGGKSVSLVCTGDNAAKIAGSGNNCARLAVGTPTGDNDAATKAYVDGLAAAGYEVITVTSTNVSNLGYDAEEGATKYTVFFDTSFDSILANLASNKPMKFNITIPDNDGDIPISFNTGYVSALGNSLYLFTGTLAGAPIALSINALGAATIYIYGEYLPDPNPDDSDDGKVLMVNKHKWEMKKPKEDFVVTITPLSPSDVPTSVDGGIAQFTAACDKTFAEIKGAIDAGKNVLGNYSGNIWPLSRATDTMIAIDGTINLGYFGDTSNATCSFVIQSNGIATITCAAGELPAVSNKVFNKVLVANNGHWDLTDTLPSPKSDGSDNGKVPTVNGTIWEMKKSVVDVDDALSDTSTNPVQNKVVKTALDGKASTEVASQTANGLMSAEDKVKLDGIEDGATRVIVDDAMSDTSANPVQNKAVKAALDGKLDKTGGTLTGNLRVTGALFSGDGLSFGTGENIHFTKAADDAGKLAHGTAGVDDTVPLARLKVAAPTEDDDAATKAYVDGRAAGTGAVRYDAAQTLTGAQKLQARKNVDAAGVNMPQFQGFLTLSPANGTLGAGVGLSPTRDGNNFALDISDVNEGTPTKLTGVKTPTDADTNAAATVEYVKAAVPTTLKNPNALTIKIGSTTVTYDGSAAKTVEIADGSEVSY